MNLCRDPVTASLIAPEEQQKNQVHWDESTRWFTTELITAEPGELCRKVYSFLDEQSRGRGGQRPIIPLCSHALDSYLSDHALLTSALAYCLGIAGSEIDWVRLAALTHEFPETAQATLLTVVEPTVREFLADAWSVLREQGQKLAKAWEDGKDNSLEPFSDTQPDFPDERLTLLWYAHLTAAQPLANHCISLPEEKTLAVIEKRSDFARHPLHLLTEQGAGSWRTIGLVHGGATKIKNYVFESAKLPEIRGGSALLDWLNQVGARQQFADAPECVIYANGGELLALTSAGQAQAIADRLEARYASETLTAQAVFVSGEFSLLELQYGLQPQEFWADNYVEQLANAGEEAQGLLRDYYGHPEPDYTDLIRFHQRKGFGECATQLALKRTWYRDGNDGAWSGQAAVARWGQPHFETVPFGQYCTSCDQRMAIVRILGLNDALCEPCARKRSTGWFMRRGDRQRADVFHQVTAWKPEELFGQEDGQFDSWYRQFEGYLGEEQGGSAQRYLRSSERTWNQVDAPDALKDIGLAAKPSGYMGLIYADGNNVGALIEKIRTAGQYRQFATRLFEATQAAVFEALATHLQPLSVKASKDNRPFIHPFEIVNIGGDDLFLIVPADKALPIAHDIAAKIEQIFSVEDAHYSSKVRPVQRYRPDEYVATGKPLISMAAGVVLSAKNTPIFFLLELVEELLKSAKKGAKERKGDGYWGGMIDFMSLKGVGMVTSGIKEYRQGALTEEKAETNEQLHLTARPYTLHEVAGLLTTARTLKTVNFPRSQLHHLRELLPKGRLIASLSYLYFSSRLGRSKHKDYQAMLRKDFDQAWHTPALEPLPWRRKGAWKPTSAQTDAAAQWETVLADLVEIYDFVGKAEEA